MIDLTLLLLLSLLAVVRISELQVDLPISQELRDQGGVYDPIQAVVSETGEIFVEGAGSVDLQTLAEFSTLQQRAVELRVDGNADAHRLLQIHQMLYEYTRPAVFMVEHQGK